MDDLNPCPSCGSEDVHLARTLVGEWWFVECYECDFDANPEGGPFGGPTQEEAREALTVDSSHGRDEKAP